ncbi:hypothetical protein J3B02_000212 [Coemansia erecta]|nr:hypothetical protein J3B02_000212 [Coemansia erecta]
MTDPLHVIVHCLVSDISLTAAFSDNPNICASLRLFDFAYIDTLSTIDSHRRQKIKAQLRNQKPNTNVSMQIINGIVRTRVVEKLLSEDASAQRNALLADCLDHIEDPVILARIEEMTLNQLFAQIEAPHEEIDKGLCLLFQAMRIPPGPWLRNLINITSQGILRLDTDSSNAQLICLLASVLEHYGASALDLLASLDCLRQLARHVIKQLSQPYPPAAASALHLLTRLLLLPHSSYIPSKSSPLTIILGDSLRGKLFDQSHIARTMMLAADLCHNCTGQDPSELLVLESVAGTVACIALHGGREYQALFEITGLAPGIHRLVVLARENRRYLHPLLRILNHFLCNADKADSPLISALMMDTEIGGSGGSAIAEVFDIALSGIEDTLCTMPVFGPTDGNNRAWPRVSSDECGAGWLVSCNKEQRTQLTKFLANALGLTRENRMADNDFISCEELAAAIGRVFEMFIAMSSKAGDYADGALGTYYWVVRPVLEITRDLVSRSPVFAHKWAKWIEESGNPGRWAMDVCRSAVMDPQTLLGDAMCQDIVVMLSKEFESTDAAAVAAAADLAGCTSRMGIEIESSPLSSTTTAGVTVGQSATDQQTTTTSAIEASKDTIKQKEQTLDPCDTIQAIVTKQWARVTKAQAALGLVNSFLPSDADSQIPTTHLKQILSKATNNLHALSLGSLQYLFMGHSAVVRQQQKHQQIILAMRSDHQEQCIQYEEYRKESESELQDLRLQVEQASGVFEQLHGLQNAMEQQKEIYNELVQEYRRSEKDAEEWKHECVETREMLERARRDIEGMREVGDRDLRGFQKYREEASRTECSLRSTVGMLETALAEAVARLRVLEIQAMAERNATEELRAKNIFMASRLAEYSKIAESLHNLTKTSNKEN